MLDLLSEPALVGLVGLFGGIILGLAARMARFCTLGAIEDILYGGNDLRTRMWGTALGVAIVGTFAATALGWADTGQSFYLAGWNIWASVIGGLLFGYGMALAGNCGYGALARLGGGDLRSFVIVLVMGVSAYVTLSGPLAAVRVALFSPTDLVSDGLANAVSAATGLPATAIGLLVGGLILALVLSSRDYLRDPRAIVWSVLVGLAIVSGWVGTTWIAREGFEGFPVVSHTFSAPVGESLLYLMTSSGGGLSFGVGSVAGVLVGAFIGSLFKGHFRWEACEDPRELTRQIGGAALMGVGAVTAVGCSIGQGLSAFSVLAPSAPIVLISIWIGASIGLRQLITGFSRV